MKKQNIITGVLLACASIGFAQWQNGTNIYNTNTGNVGINNSSPSFKLDLTTSSSGGDGIRVTQNTIGSAGLRLKNSSSGGHEYALYSMGYQDPYPGSFNIYDYAASAYRFFIKSDGNVGIGTTSPSENFHVNGTIRVDGSGGNGGVRIFRPGLDAIQSGLYLGNTNNDKAFNFQLNANGSALHLYTYNSGWNNRFAFTASGSFIVGYPTYTDANAKLAVNGKTQIGNQLQTSSAHYNDYLLSVNGKGVFKEVIVTNSNWADFVFSNDYKLPSLKDVEAYYKENKHLPEIPSAKDVEENGINVGDMNKLLLQKIEELTIYMVQQQKEIDALKAKSKE